MITQNQKFNVDFPNVILHNGFKFNVKLQFNAYLYTL